MNSVEGISDDFEIENYSLPPRSSFAHDLREKTSYLLFHAASHLTEPLCKERAIFHWIVSPFDAEASLSAKVQETFHRALGWILFSYTALASSAIAAVGAVIRHAGVKIRNSSDFSHWKGDAPEKKFNPQKGYFVKSWDITALADRSLLKGRPEPTQRAKEIIDIAKQKNPDVLCLFNVRDESLVYALYEALKSDYANFYVFCGTKGHRPGNYALFAVKFHTEHFSFGPYKDRSGWANQGFVHFALSSNGKIFSRIVAAEMDKNSPQLREKQLMQITSRLTEIHREDPKKEEWIPKVLVDSTSQRDLDEYHGELGFGRFFETGYQDSTTRTIGRMFRLLEGKNLLPPCCTIKVTPLPDHSLLAHVKVWQPLPETA